MPKVVHLTSAHPAFDTRIFHKECRTLARHGFDVVLVAPHDRDETVDGVRIRAVRRRSGRVMRMSRTAAEVIRLARAEDADLYHVHDPELLPWARVCLRDERLVFDMHENVSGALRTKSWIPVPLRRPVAAAYRRAEQPLLNGLPVIYAERSYVRDYPFVARSCTVLNLPMADELLGIDAERYVTPTVGYMGVVSPARGALVTVRALDLLRERGIQVEWECVGGMSSRFEAELRAVAAHLPKDAVRLRGRLPFAAGLSLMARCHIGLALLEPVPNYVESYPTKLFEYMALGLPVLASDFRLYREVVEQLGCGICVDPCDSAEIARAISYLLENPAEARAMGMRGREAVRHRFNWETEAQKLIAFYDALLSEGRHATVWGGAA